MIESLDAIVSGARTALGNTGKTVGSPAGQAPRFELFNAPNSICSQKVRVVLAQLGLPYVSQSMNLFTGQTYLPDYVRLRMIGCEQMGASLMTVHTGSTSVTTGGCDPAVVPALVDWQTGDVIVDSKRICFYVDDVRASDDATAGLRPAQWVEQIDEQLAIVDNLPNYQMLSGKPPSGAHRQVTRPPGSGVEFAMSKVQRCDDYLAKFSDDETLVMAYNAKRSKELTAAQQLFTAEAMQAAYDKCEAGCEGFEQLLAKRKATWIFNDEITMADLFWTIELLRIRNMGAEGFWTNGKRPAVEAFLKQGEAIPAIRSAILDWPGAMF